MVNKIRKQTRQPQKQRQTRELRIWIKMKEAVLLAKLLPYQGKSRLKFAYCLVGVLTSDRNFLSSYSIKIFQISSFPALAAAQCSWLSWWLHEHTWKQNYVSQLRPTKSYQNQVKAFEKISTFRNFYLWLFEPANPKEKEPFFQKLWTFLFWENVYELTHLKNERTIKNSSGSLRSVIKFFSEELLPSPFWHWKRDLALRECLAVFLLTWRSRILMTISGSSKIYVHGIEKSSNLNQIVYTRASIQIEMCVSKKSLHDCNDWPWVFPFPASEVENEYH